MDTSLKYSYLVSFPKVSLCRPCFTTYSPRHSTPPLHWFLQKKKKKKKKKRNQKSNYSKSYEVIYLSKMWNIWRDTTEHSTISLNSSFSLYHYLQFPPLLCSNWFSVPLYRSGQARVCCGTKQSPDQWLNTNIYIGMRPSLMALGVTYRDNLSLRLNYIFYTMDSYLDSENIIIGKGRPCSTLKGAINFILAYWLLN